MIETPVETVERIFTNNMGTLRARHHVDEAIHVLEFDGALDRRIRTYASIGLSRLTLAQKQEPLRQEVIFDCEPTFANEAWVTLVTHLAGIAALRGTTLQLFEVLELDAGLRRLTRIPAVMCWSPLYHSDAVQFIPSTTPATVPVWLMALTEQESTFANERGWEDLMALIEERQPDALDLKRRSIV